MQLSLLTLTVTSALAAAFPMPAKGGAAAAAGVLTVQSYADFQVSDGVAGNALDEVNAKFPVRLSPPSPFPLPLPLFLVRLLMPGPC